MMRCFLERINNALFLGGKSMTGCFESESMMQCLFSVQIKDDVAFSEKDNDAVFVFWSKSRTPCLFLFRLEHINDTVFVSGASESRRIVFLNISMTLCLRFVEQINR